MLDYNDLFLFIEVAKCGSFSVASKVLNLSQPQLSRRIQKLEKSLGVNLFRRLASSVELTDRGEDLYQKLSLQKWLLDSDIHNYMLNLSKSPGALKVVLPAVFAYHVITPHLPDFIQQHPELKLQIKYSHSAVNIYESGADFMVSSSIPKQKALLIKTICNCSCGFYTTPTYLAKYGNPESPDQLAKYLVVSYISSDGHTPDDLVFTHNTEQRKFVVSNRTQLLINDDLQAEAMLNSNQIIVGGYDFCFSKGIVGGEYIKLFEDYSFLSVPFYQITPPHKKDARVTLFAEFISDCIKQAKLI